MITPREEDYIREKAYVPEHVIPLMVGISQAEPFFREDYLFFLKDNWMIFVGYPLGGEFREEAFSAILEKVQNQFQPASLWFIAPGIPESLLPRVQKRETDEYYRLDLRQSGVKRSLQREVEKASLALRVEKHRGWSPEHESLTREFLEKENLNPRVRELYLRMPRVLGPFGNIPGPECPRLEGESFRILRRRDGGTKICHLCGRMLFAEPLRFPRLRSSIP